MANAECAAPCEGHGLFGVHPHGQRVGGGAYKTERNVERKVAFATFRDADDWMGQWIGPGESRFHTIIF